MTIHAENNKKTEAIKESLGVLLAKLESQKQIIAASKSYIYTELFFKNPALRDYGFLDYKSQIDPNLLIGNKIVTNRYLFFPENKSSEQLNKLEHTVFKLAF